MLKKPLPYAIVSQVNLDMRDDNTEHTPKYFSGVFDHVEEEKSETVSYGEFVGAHTFDFEQTGFTAPLNSAAMVHLAVYANVTRWVCGLLDCSADIGFDNDIGGYLHIIRGPYGDFVIACVEPSWLTDIAGIARSGSTGCSRLAGFVAAHSSATSFALTNYADWLFGWLVPGPAEGEITLHDTVLNCTATYPSVREQVLRHVCEDLRFDTWMLLERRRRLARKAERGGKTCEFPPLSTVFNIMMSFSSRRPPLGRLQLPRLLDGLHDDIRLTTVAVLSEHIRRVTVARSPGGLKPWDGPSSGTPIALIEKTVTSPQKLKDLIAIYEALSELQGGAVPYVHSVVATDPFREPFRREFGLLLSDCGSVILEQWLENPRNGDTNHYVDFVGHHDMVKHIGDSALRQVTSLHRCGVVHQHLQGHIMIDVHDLSVGIVGFGGAQISTSQGLRNNDLQVLQTILNRTSNSQT